MAIVVSEGVIEISVQGEVAGRPWASVWHMRNEGGGVIPADEPEAVVEDFRNNWQDHMMGNLDNDVSVTAFVWLSLNSADGQTGVVLPDPSKPVNGGINSGAAPPNVSWLINKTASGGRGTRNGRAYLPGVPEAGVDDAGGVEPAYITGWVPALADFLSGISDGGGLDPARYPVVLRRPAESRIPGTQIVEVDSSRITALTLDSRVATQRRRLRR